MEALTLVQNFCREFWSEFVKIFSNLRVYIVKYRPMN
jgi:hypothetical protein